MTTKTTKKLKPVTVQRNAENLWSELNELCKKARHWLYVRKDRTKAKRYAGRLERVLGELPVNDLAILREEGLALLSELKGQFNEAIAHRKREIHLMKRLHAEARSPGYAASTRAYMLRGRSVAVLQKRKSILESLQNGVAHLNGRRPTTARRA